MKVSLSQLIRDCTDLAQIIDFSRDGFGQKLAHAAAECMLENANAGCDPDGHPWAPLSDDYADWKQAVAPGMPIGFLYGFMLDLAELDGAQDVTPHRVTHTYGVSARAKVEAVKFELGGAVTGTNQPPRPFWGFTHQAVAAMNAASDKHFEEGLKAIEGSGSAAP